VKYLLISLAVLVVGLVAWYFIKGKSVLPSVTLNVKDPPTTKKP
jgi:hypothetical protein